MERHGKKSAIEIMRDGMIAHRKKLAEGYQETPDGLLKMSDIKEAGYVLDDKDNWQIPLIEYISDGTSDREAGQKYLGISLQYIEWRKKRTNPEYKKAKPNKFNFKEKVESPPVFKDTDDINVDEIPF